MPTNARVICDPKKSECAIVNSGVESLDGYQFNGGLCSLTSTENPSTALPESGPVTVTTNTNYSCGGWWGIGGQDVKLSITRDANNTLRFANIFWTDSNNYTQVTLDTDKKIISLK